MSEQPNTPAPEQATPPEGAPTEDPKTFDAEYVDKLRKEAAKYRTEAKANSDAASRLAAIEDAQKSEAEKQAARLSTAEKQAADASLALARMEVALDKGLTPSQAKRLIGTTREEFEADADDLLKDIGEAGKPRTPRPDPAQGRTPSGAPLDPRSADLAQIEADMKAASRR